MMKRKTSVESRLKLFEHELSTRRYRLGDNHPAVAETLNVLGIVHFHVHANHKQSLTLHQQALNILSSQIPNNKLRATQGVIYADIGDVLWTMGRIKEATSHYVEAYTLLKKANVSQIHPVMYSIRTRFPGLVDSFRKEVLLEMDKDRLIVIKYY